MKKMVEYLCLVIPAPLSAGLTPAGIQKKTGFRVKHGMTEWEQDKEDKK
jgi:hypothetical protein